MTKFRALALCVAGSTLVHSSAVRACSCFPGATLEQQYNNADNVLVAKISACEPSYLSDEGHCSLHRWTFETIENLKGSDAYVRAQRDEGVRSTCDISLKVDETYLLFLREGRTQLCSGTAPLSGESGVRRSQDIEMLRSFRGGRIGQIKNPWYFSDNGWQCSIDHQLDAVARIQFNYQYDSPPQNKAVSAANPIVRMRLSLVEPFEFRGATRLEVDGSVVSLTRVNLELRPGAKLSFETVQGEAAAALLDAMSRSAEIAISGNRSTPSTPEQLYRATADITQLPEVVNKFRACIAAHGMSKDAMERD